MKKRTAKPSNAVKKTATVGSALSGLGAVGLAWAANKYQLKADDVALAAAGLTQVIALATAWSSRGGRSGEAD